MYGSFELVLRGWRRFGRLPRGPLWTLATLDRRWRIGTPMDLIVLSQLPSASAPPPWTPSRASYLYA